MNDMPLRAMLLMSGFALAWVVVEEVIGGSLSQPYPLLQIVWCRYAVHLALMLLFNLSAPGRLWRTRRPGFHLSRSLLMLVMPASFAMSVQAGVPAGSVWALFWVAPLIALGFARELLGEAVPSRTWWICGLGTATAAAMMMDRHTTPGLALMLPIVMAASFGGYVVMTRQLEGELLQTNLFHTALGVFVTLTPIVPWSWVMPTAHDFVVLAGIGAVGLLALWALDRAVAAAPVSASVPALYLYMPALVLAVMAVRGEVPSPRRVLGGALICIAVAWLVRMQGRELVLGQRKVSAG
ncbi:MAG: DMT family transporter [Sinobacteraceae bacterium]|nr:DMT family transporter [Nevskiaceae bacterium]